MKRHFFRNLILRMLTPIQKIMQKVAKSIRLVGAVTPQDLFEHKLLKTLLNSCERK